MHVRRGLALGAGVIGPLCVTDCPVPHLLHISRLSQLPFSPFFVLYVVKNVHIKANIGERTVETGNGYAADAFLVYQIFVFVTIL